MIFNLFSIIILLPVLLGFGSLWQRFFGKIWLGMSGILVSGFFLLLIVFQLFAFFIPLNLNVEIGILIIGWGLFYAFGNHIRIWDFVKENKIGFSIFLSVSIIIGSFYPFLVDHFGYYVPTIKWISEYGLVKGITNFEWILGQMSPWHIFQSAFSHFTDPFLRLNVLLIFVFFLYILEKKSWILLACSPFLFFFVQSPSPDLPSIIFSLMILNEILYHNKNSALLFGFSVLIFSIKPTMIWVPILAFLHGFWIQKKQFSFLVLGIFVFGIYVFKNIWVFGLPLFPLNILDLGLSWKPHPQFFLDSAQFAQMKTFDMQYSIEEIKTFSMWDYFNNFLNVEGIKGIINKAFILCLIALTFICIQKKE